MTVEGSRANSLHIVRPGRPVAGAADPGADSPGKGSLLEEDTNSDNLLRADLGAKKDLAKEVNKDNQASASRRMLPPLLPPPVLVTGTGKGAEAAVEATSQEAQIAARGAEVLVSLNEKKEQMEARAQISAIRNAPRVVDTRKYTRIDDKKK